MKWWGVGRNTIGRECFGEVEGGERHCKKESGGEGGVEGRERRWEEGGGGKERRVWGCRGGVERKKGGGDMG